MRILFRSFWLRVTVILSVAFSLRLLQLGAAPLGDAEAAWALQSLALTRGQPALAGANILYVQATALFFFLFQASNFMARLFPALAGGFLSLLPLAFAPQLGRRAAWLTALFWALDPGLLALSRQAGSGLAAWGLLALALALWRAQRPKIAGALTGLALLSGMEVWPAALSLLLGLMAWRALSERPFAWGGRDAWRQAIFSGVPVFLLAGTLFFFNSSALGGLFRWDFFAAPGLPLWVWGLTPLVYAPLAFGFGLAQAVLGLIRRKAVDGFLLAAALSLFALAPLLQNLTLLAWAQALLWPLAARLLVALFRSRPRARWETLAMALLTALLLVFAVLDFTPVAAGRLDTTTAQLYLLMSLAAVFMLLISVLLVAQGWDWQVAWQGTLRGGLLTLAVYLLSMSFFAAGLKTFASFEFWRPSQQAVQARALQETMNTLALQKTGAAYRLDVSLVQIQSPSLLWALRDWPVTPTQNFAPDAAPALIITPQDFSSPQLQSAYRGADFRWEQTPLWAQASQADWLRWSVEHSLPSQPKNLILWARADLFDHESLP